MRTTSIAIIFMLMGCTAEPGEPQSSSAQPATSNANVKDSNAMTSSRNLQLIRYEPSQSETGSSLPGPLARTEGVLVARNGCVWLETGEQSMPLVFEKGDASSAENTVLVAADGTRIAFGSRVELAGSSVSDSQGAYPLADVERACGVRRAILVTGGSLRAAGS